MKKFFSKLLNVTWVIPADKLQNDNSLQIQSINDVDSLHEALGITDERAKQLALLVDDSISKTNRTTEAMELVSKELKHANELYMASVMMHKRLDMMHNPLLAIMKDALK